MSECLHFLDGIAIDEYIYFASSDFNALFRWNISSHETEFLSFFPDEEVFVHNIYGHVIRQGENIFFLPIHGKTISVYDIQNHKIDSITFREGGNESMHISSYIPLEDKYLLIPAYLEKDFWFLYPEERRVEKASQISKEISCLIEGEGSAICRYQGACTFKGEILISVVNQEYFLAINIVSEKARKIPINSFKTNNMYAGSDNLWLVSSDGREIVKWYSEENYERTTFNDVEDKAFFTVTPYIDTFLLLPWRGNEVKKYDKEEGIWKTFIILDNKEEKRALVKYCACGNYENFIFLYPSSCNELICINTDNDYVEMMQLHPGENFENMLYQLHFNTNNCIYESMFDDAKLTSFLKIILDEG
ncbi:hypothetical protein [Pseudobutyrivibrio xylanivorans]|uniref:WD40 repeat domain-containing protein n=1 Tax=Pseudobutyrivibrio xylanivorans DSM 14809 TaxID=1123012 RepID=A0A1M6D9C3_PSEXY|nr:hypothetical protein [Pseudobutyrivibrio xylanivorans]SHI69761.1 hypothetical protein SAMN02745725_00896 [Pseudobutyrivibrio xylanivorans DSM 14809]